MLLMILVLILVGAAVFMALDFTWLGVVATGIYNAAYGSHIRVVDGMFQFKFLPALILYPVIALGIWYFVLSTPGFSWSQVAFRGAFLGFLLYAVYNLTCASILSDYPWNIVFIDTAWGTFATMVAAVAMRWVSNFFS